VELKAGTEGVVQDERQEIDQADVLGEKARRGAGEMNGGQVGKPGGSLDLGLRLATSGP